MINANSIFLYNSMLKKLLSEFAESEYNHSRLIDIYLGVYDTAS